MKLEGTLDAFSLPEIFTLLSATRKTGTLQVRRDQGGHGAVHLRDGAITGARAQVDRQELGRRLVGAGLVDDATLVKAVERVGHSEGTGLGRMLADTASLDADTVRRFAVEQAVDAVFDLLRWTDGSFAFSADQTDPDDLGVDLAVDHVVAEASRRLEAWPTLVAVVPSTDAVVAVVPSPVDAPEVAAHEWWLLALVDGSRTVDDLVGLTGRGEFAVVSVLVGLVQRGLLAVLRADDAALTSLQRRQVLLAGLEGRPVDGPGASPLPVLLPAQPALVAPREPSDAAPTPAAPTPPRHGAQPVPASLPAFLSAPVGSVHGATALQLRGETQAQPQPGQDPLALAGAAPGLAPGVVLDPSVDTSLLLRLIAGVRGL